MSFGNAAGFAARMLGIAGSIWVAGSLAWAGVERDAATGMASWQEKANIKQEYRNSPGILTCHTVMTLFNEFSPQKTTIVTIPAPADRGPNFDLTALDASVDQQDCTLDTSQQVLWMAARQTPQPNPNYAQTTARRPENLASHLPVRRSGDTSRGLASYTRRGLEKS